MSTADEGVREIQLSGKQLVFLFMAVTVVSVVIFLCGVLVGRGVQAAPPPMVDAPALDGGAPDESLPPVTDVAAADQPTPAGDVTFPSRLQDDAPPAEKLVPRADPAKAATPPAAPASTAAAPPKTSREPAPTAAARPTAGIPTEPKGNGYAIQVAAFTAREEAETLVTRLLGKGYAVFLVTPQAGQPAMFRVRVGKFQQRAEAERVAARLEREEQFKPWITR
ncbi:MAG: SPOR domain-containing protein [Vicinamibacterales bacterium]